MATPHTPPKKKTPPPGKLATFGTWKKWIDSRAPGAGNTWIKWVEAHAKIVPPESDVVDLNSNVFPKGGSFLSGSTSNHASNWFAAWFLEGNVGPELAKLLAGAISKTAGKIPGILQDTGEGIGKVPGATALGALESFLTGLENGQFWFRIFKIVGGGVLVVLGLNKLSGGKIEQVAGKIAK